MKQISLIIQLILVIIFTVWFIILQKRDKPIFIGHILAYFCLSFADWILYLGSISLYAWWAVGVLFSASIIEVFVSLIGSLLAKNFKEIKND